MLDEWRNFSVLYHVGLLPIALCLFLTQVGASLLGNWLGRRHDRQIDDEAEAYAGNLEGVLFNLLTLTLSFTLAFALARDEARRTVMSEEAKAITQAYLRAQTLPQPFNDQASGKLRTYLQNREELYQAQPATSEFYRVIQDTDDQHADLWNDFRALNARYPEALFNEKYSDALSGMVDAHATRVRALEYHIPEVVLWILIVLTVATNFGMGYTRGLAGNQQVFTQLFVTLIVVMMNMVIMDADRPRRGLIQVTDEPLQHVAHLFDSVDQEAGRPPAPALTRP